MKLFNPLPSHSLVEMAGLGLAVARVLVTGAAGFIGRALCAGLTARGHSVIAGLRRVPPAGAPPIAAAALRVLGDITPRRGWGNELRDVDIVVHLAQRAHRRAAAAVLAGEPAAAASLAAGAGRVGVRRFVYMSSVKALGDATLPGRPFRADDPPQPADAYGRTKLATEQALFRAAFETGVEIVVLRPPLVYGPGVAGNFRALAWLAASGMPLPFAAFDNHRSLIFIDNLVDLTATALLHPAAPGRMWLAADAEDLPVAALIRLLAQAQGRAARLFRAPSALFAGLRLVPALGPAFARLTLPLQVDHSATRAELGWMPPVAVEAAIVATARALANG